VLFPSEVKLALSRRGVIEKAVLGGYAEPMMRRRRVTDGSLRKRLDELGRRLPALTERTLARFFNHRDTQIAAAISYYALLSIFPLAIVMVAVFGIVVDDQAARQRVIDFLLRNLPLDEQAGRRDLEELLAGVTRNAGALSVIGAAGLVLTASGLMGAIRNGLNGAWEVKDRRPPLQGKALDILLVLGVAVVIALSSALTVAGRAAASVSDWLEEVLGAVGSALPRLLLELGPLSSLVLAFGLYLSSFGNYNAVYGSIGAVVAFAVFVFLGANVFLLGAEASAEWKTLRHEELEPGPPWREKVRAFLKGLVVRRGRGAAPGKGRHVA